MTPPNGPSFDPAGYVAELEAEARQGDWTIRYLSPAAGFARPWLQRPARTGAEAPRLYLSAGIHGDEIAGPLAVLEMLQRPAFFDAFDVTIFPILNPVGLSRGVRTNADGIDLNRDYLNSKSTEIGGHVAALQRLGRYEAAIFLHEDYEGIGAYLYELNDSVQGLGLEMIAAMGRHVPIDLRPEIEEVPATGGVLNRRDLLQKLGPIEDRLEWPEAIYLSLYHTGASYTTETPMPFPLAQRIAAQIAAVEVVQASLLRQHTSTERKPRPHSAVIPTPKIEDDNYGWWERHRAVLAEKKTMDPEIVLIGDSIVHFWGGRPEAKTVNGAAAWENLFHGRSVLNLGFGWDRTQNVLWRLERGEFEGLHPKTVIILVGTNNLTGTTRARPNTPAQIVEGIVEICALVRTFSPRSRIIVTALFPRGAQPDDPMRRKVEAVNVELRRVLAHRSDIELVDLTGKFLRADGTLPEMLMPDGVHPSDAGYQVWAEALRKAGVGARAM